MNPRLGNQHKLLPAHLTVIWTTLYLSRFFEICFCFDYVRYAGSIDLVRQWSAVHNQNKQGFLNETF